MAQEMDEGVAYLRALKQSTGSHAAAVPARVPSPEAGAPVGDSAQGFKGAEKRRSPRYRCEGSAQIREEGCDVHTWATFNDISLHGCYVEAQATYPVGTNLQLKLEANGIRVESKGNVRVSYPYLGMGIAFVDMSDESMTCLKQLLRTVSHRSVIMGPGIASTLPSSGPLEAVPLISNAQAAIQAILEFFETRQMLMRDDFLKILRKSQK